MKPSQERLETVLALMKSQLESRHGIAVRFVDVPAPYTGDLDGAEIHLQPDHELGMIVFTLSHLFGHTVQWSLAGRAWQPDAGDDGIYQEDELAAVERFEREASCYGLGLLHELGVTDLDGWISDFAACDYRYLDHFYRTGEKRPPEEFWKDDQPLLTPLPIPDFRPRHFKLRWDGVVL